MPKPRKRKPKPARETLLREQRAIELDRSLRRAIAKERRIARSVRVLDRAVGASNEELGRLRRLIDATLTDTRGDEPAPASAPPVERSH